MRRLTTDAGTKPIGPSAGAALLRGAALLIAAVLGLPALSPRPALADDTSCGFGPPRSSWVETSVVVAERGHDTPVMTSTTRVGVPRDWPGAAALLGDGSAVGCLLPPGGTPSVTVPADGADVVVQSTRETPLELYDTEWGAESAGLWSSRTSGDTRFVALLPSPADLPPGLAGARWRTVVVKTPEFRARTVTPLPSEVLPGGTYVWRDGAAPPRVEVALPLSARSAFQRWSGLRGQDVLTVGTYLGFALPYLLLAGLLVVLYRRSGDRDERVLVRITLGALAMITATEAVLIVGVLTGTLFLAGLFQVPETLAILVVAAPLFLAVRGLARTGLRWGLPMLAGAVLAAVGGLALLAARLFGDQPSDPLRVAPAVVTALLLTGAAWAIAVRAARVRGRTPRAVRALLCWSVPGLALLTLAYVTQTAVVGLRTSSFLPAAATSPFFLLRSLAYLMWPLVVLLLLLLLRLHGRRTDSVGPSTLWLLVFLFVVGTIRWLNTYAGMPFPLAGLVGLGALPLLLRLTRRAEVADPGVSRRRLAMIVDEYRDLEQREKGLRRRWAAGELDDEEHTKEAGPVVGRIRRLRMEIGLDPDREDGLSPLDVALSRGPGVTWWANARLAARYASYVGAPAAVFLIWATWSTDSRGHDGWLDRLGDPDGFYGLAGDLIGGLLIWPVAGFVLGALWRRLPGRRGYLKGVVPVLAYAAATGAHAVLNNVIGQAPVRGSLVRVLLLFLVLTVVAVLMDARTLQTRPGGLASRLTPVAVVYRLGTAGSGIALIVAQAAAILGLWSQLRNGIDITSQVDTSAQAQVGADAQVLLGRVDR
ncbi:hypothetical protein SAMN05421833_11091 [Microbispora rosea]|uniref:Uncharacterized protein n=1 Tax=Microbispora rosea TaxID=58117 RepID=A0A1N7BNU3_9ACTN|nr:DUF6185 family protein [Microbispora rosea]GIH46059.1 hypothetical protein Mro03_12380 [Microbispora rosea subsp. rosea]SIR52972.1 hypothetical protein SAMN05421833_11091 [Microbispora rosea]